MRGVDLGNLLEQARQSSDEDLPPLAFGACEEPILFPEGEDGDLENILTPGQSRRLLGVLSPHVGRAVETAMQAYEDSAPAAQISAENGDSAADAK